MRILLSVVGTRGDVQPVVALALAVRELGHDVRLCVPPNFVELASTLDFPATPVGIEMRAPRKGAPPAPSVTAVDLIADQFERIEPAARGCDIILGANAHQYAARSIAERHGIPYVNAVYSPTALPDEANTRSWNERALGRVNANRARLGLSPIEDVLRHILTDEPWLAADPTLAPTPSMSGRPVFQTGAWILDDTTPLPVEVERFLDAGERPVYFGFGSMPIAHGTTHTLLDAARAAGQRAIIAEGWAELDRVENESDCIVIGDVNHHLLFQRVSAVVHHGGAGTTVTAAAAGIPQVIAPMFGDQPFWASRVGELGIGTSFPIAELTSTRLAAALQRADDAGIRQQATSTAARIVVDGAAVAARALTGSSPHDPSTGDSST